MLKQDTQLHKGPKQLMLTLLRHSWGPTSWGAASGLQYQIVEPGIHSTAWGLQAWTVSELKIQEPGIHTLSGRLQSGGLQ